MISTSLIWLILAVVFGITEAATVGFVSLWFMFGSIAAFFTSFAGLNLTAQLFVFIIVSFLLLISVRPLSKKYINNKITKTNYDIIIGKEGVVINDVSNILATGEVKVDGKYWTARTTDDRTIIKGSRVKVISIEGVKVIVQEISPII